SALPGPYQVLIAKVSVEDLDAVAQAVGKGILRLPIARTVPLGRAIEALTELERDRTPKGGKLVITTE
ncbi:zinc-binding dehydrogenase, partial [Streptomyces sp. 110]